jgi:methylated-DNA-[protein]-cysteine S-methyltransferase
MRNTCAEILVFDTDLGWFGLARSARGLCASILFRTQREHVMEGLFVACPQGVVIEERAWSGVVQRVRDFARGQVVHFDDVHLDLDGCTTFEREVYKMVRTVPWGETVAYSDVARAIERPFAARAVGQAMSRNPLPLIVPCHRVIAADGSIGGFGGGTGVVLKRRMLALEGCHPGGD